MTHVVVMGMTIIIQSFEKSCMCTR